jgi:DNA-binding transcriptional LysR family regulator
MSSTNIDLRHLRHAVALAEAGSYVSASSRLGLTQSALTRSIQALEAATGLRLFDRDRGGVHPTGDGQLFLDRARALLRDSRSLDMLVGELTSGATGEVRLGLGPLPASILLPELLLRLLAERPGVRLTISIQAAATLLAELLAERIDLFVCSSGLVDRDAPVTRTELATVRSALLVRSGHPLARRPDLGAAALASYPLISGRLIDRPPGTGPAARELTIACDDFGSLKAVTLASDAIWLTSPHAAREELRAGTLAVLNAQRPEAAAPLALALYRLRGRTAARASRHVEDNMRTILREAAAAA